MIFLNYVFWMLTSVSQIQKIYQRLRLFKNIIISAWPTFGSEGKTRIIVLNLSVKQRYDLQYLYCVFSFSMNILP